MIKRLKSWLCRDLHWLLCSGGIIAFGLWIFLWGVLFCQHNKVEIGTKLGFLGLGILISGLLIFGWSSNLKEAPK